MIKVITLITKFIAITLIALFFGSCNQISDLRSIKGSGHVTTEKRTVTGDFKNVEISNALDLVIEQSDKTEIIVEADDNLQKEITTKIENGVLVIACKSGNFINVASKKITVKMPVIEGLEASSASTINSSNTLKGSRLNLVSSSAGSINATVEYENIQLSSSSASNQNIKGKAIRIETSASSGSVLDASELLTNEATADASSGSSISVSPIVSLKAEASSGGNISYSKTPKSIQKEENSGGSINQQ
ncbi:head GIN domain-containing protein [Flavobacterium aquicola]|uniref:Putative autotransporter adhesin-like protein n=1 Tax=Flavobacterium aquicola TaxID=1682742 RepID=A0A3E0EMZ1_9FLAO|nr:head GIN domain-containing protein [Flavobacterium aquicola]REG98516.1 putative autotransporter adhesin-like protein [Flavobacterium aquicola]